MDSAELLNKQDLCIVDEPAPCSAICPIHVDVISFVEELKKGNFKKAYKILNKKMPFTRIISKICDHPCEKECLREELGGAIQISKLEAAAAESGYTPPKKGLPIPRKNSKMAVIGGGISGLTAAQLLDKKGYSTTIYEAAERLGGSLWNFTPDRLSEELLNEEIENLKDAKIKIELKTEVGRDISLKEILAEFNAVYLAAGSWHKNYEIDLNTFQTEIDNLFVGGALIKAHNNSIIQSVSTGLRAANSMIRFVNDKSLTASRENEGSQETLFELNFDKYSSEEKIELKLDSKNIDQHIIKEAERCLICHCTECMEACAHLEKFDVFPKRYIRKINHNNNIKLGNHRANELINSCALCGLCGEVCPNSLNMKEIIEKTRKSMFDRGKMPPSAHDFALKEMEFNKGKNFKLLKHQPGTDSSSYIFFPGCQMGSSGSEYVSEVYQYLIDNTDSNVGLMFNCCGAPAEWAGRSAKFEKSLEEIRTDWKQMGEPAFILACSTCYSIFKNNLPEIEILSLWDLINKYGVPKAETVKANMALSIHDACTTRYDESIQKSVRGIVSSLGYSISELEYSKEDTECCGYGGLVLYANRDQAEDFIEKRINESSNDYLAYCFMCQDLFSSKGKRTVHLLDLIYADDIDQAAEKRGPTLSERHENRTKLKINILKEMWGETVNDLNVNDDLNLKMPDDLIDKMEKRLILKENIIEVIKYAEKNDNKFVDPKTGHFLAYKKIANVTFWVEYEKEDDSYIVNKAYSHRMTIVEE